MSTTIYVLDRNVKNIGIFYLKIFPFLVVKISIYLNRHVFVMIQFDSLSFYSSDKSESIFLLVITRRNNGTSL